MIGLNLGCGQDIKKGYVNLDCIALPGVDVTHNLDVFPYPFGNDTFDEVLAFGILEHLKNPERVMQELYRITKNGATLTIRVPYWNTMQVWMDITHKRGFTLDTFHYFERQNNNWYFNYHFIVVKQTLIPQGLGKLIPTQTLKRLISNHISNIVEMLLIELKTDKGEEK